jgi:hypothetical protein
MNVFFITTIFFITVSKLRPFFFLVKQPGDIIRLGKFSRISGAKVFPAE